LKQLQQEIKNNPKISGEDVVKGVVALQNTIDALQEFEMENAFAKQITAIAGDEESMKQAISMMSLIPGPVGLTLGLVSVGINISDGNYASAAASLFPFGKAGKTLGGKIIGTTSGEIMGEIAGGTFGSGLAGLGAAAMDGEVKLFDEAKFLSTLAFGAFN